MKINYDSNSPYFNTEQTRWYMGNYKHRAILPSGDDELVEITAQYHERPDLFSYHRYNTPAFWWTFMVRNMNSMRDPIYDFKVGKKLYIPSISSLRRQLG